MKRTEIKLVNGENAVVVDDGKIKILKSEKYNFLFQKSDGFFARFGKTQEDDGDPSLGIPEIADIEISTACKQGCSFCYKSNNPDGVNMSLETYKQLFSKLPLSVTQVAFGITDIDANPDMWDIFDYTRSNGVIPNVTINGSRMKPELYDRLSKTMGAVAVSVGTGYNKDNSYNSIKELTDRGMKQVNIHNMICLENFDYTIQVMKDCKTDERLKNLNALVLLSLKTKGRAENRFHPLPQDKFNELCKFALSENISIGFDSCSSHKFFSYLDSDKSLTDDFKNNMKNCVEPCESGCYSSYIDTEGFYFPCSFTPGTDDWKEGLNVLECDDFIDDIWQHEKTVKFRNKLIGCNRDCPLYKI
jgi:MoaA/NifB/PqqE/SkfB family radical SAM enzyme